MNGIDISGHQKGIDLSKVPADFVIIKATQGKTYTNKDYYRAAAQTVDQGKCLGLYHYINGSGVDGELAHFLKIAKPYIGKAILCLDWEGEQNKQWKNHAYAVVFAQKLHKETGIIPILYMSKSVCREYNWKAASGFFLWCAQYKDSKPTGYQEKPWTDSKGWGAWKAPVIMQYSSKGRLPGYNGNLDLNYTAATPDMWETACKPAAQITLEPQGEAKNGNPYDIPTCLIKLGTRGNAARWLQYELNAWSLDHNPPYCLKVDGIIGNKSIVALKDFQTRNSLTVDGIAGPATISALVNALHYI